MALAGGVSITFPQQRGHVYSGGRHRLLRRRSHAVPSTPPPPAPSSRHGVGVVLLKRLEDALRDGDHIAAVIRGFAINNDGAPPRPATWLPGVDGQARALAAAQAMAGSRPPPLSATSRPTAPATPARRPHRNRRPHPDLPPTPPTRTHFCTIGTAKGNVGHLDVAAGVTGVIKTVALHAAPHVARPRPLPIPQSPTSTSPKLALPLHRRNLCLDQRMIPLRAGVSAFGVGGVNAHAILEEAPAAARAARLRSQPRHRAARSAGRTEVALAAGRRHTTSRSLPRKRNPDASLADAAFTLNHRTSKRPRAFRIAVRRQGLPTTPSPDSDRRQAGTPISPLQKPARYRLLSSPARELPVRRHGQAELYDFRACLPLRSWTSPPNWLRPLLVGLDLRDPPLRRPRPTPLSAAKLEAHPSSPSPRIFVTELALARALAILGHCNPPPWCGHSLGEYVAATIAGVFSLATTHSAARLPSACRMMQALATRRHDLRAIQTKQAARPRTSTPGISIAALNAPRSTVLSGTIPTLSQALEGASRAPTGVASRRLRTSHAFHSEMMEPMLVAFEAEVAKLEPA